MKRLAIMFILLFNVSAGYGDDFGDEYQKNRDSIQERMDISPSEGYIVANYFAWGCHRYIDGFIAGNLINGNLQELDNRRYADWLIKRDKLNEQIRHFFDINDIGHVAYYAKKLFESNCQYQLTLQRETYK